MARDIDRLIDHVKGLWWLPPVHKQVLINRIESEPTQEELDRAHEQVYPKVVPDA